MGVACVEGYEVAIGDVLGSRIDPLSWSAAVLDTGLRMALAEYEVAAPAVSVEWQVVTGGIKQDLGAIGDLRKVAAVAWPWVATGDVIFERAEHWVRFATFDGALVRFLDCEPSAGDWLLVRYWRKFWIGGLDGYEVVGSNVPVNDQVLLALGGAGHACTVRMRQLSEQPGVPAQMMVDLRAMRDGLLVGFAAGLASLRVGGWLGGVSWGNIGL